MIRFLESFLFHITLIKSVFGLAGLINVAKCEFRLWHIGKYLIYEGNLASLLPVSDILEANIGKYLRYLFGDLASLLPVREIESSVAVTSTAGVCHVVLMR